MIAGRCSEVWGAAPSERNVVTGEGTKLKGSGIRVSCGAVGEEDNIFLIAYLFSEGTTQEWEVLY